jgi:hypothetical protein
LREAAPGVQFIEIDTLDLAHLHDLDEGLHHMSSVIHDADAVVAHSSAARPVLEIVAREQKSTAILLLSPLIVTHQTRTLRTLRALLNWPPFGRALNSYAGKKLKRLRHDRSYVKRQLRLFVAERSCSEALIDEAQIRLRDPRSERIAEWTAEFFRYSTAPLGNEAREVLSKSTVLVGTGLLDRKSSKRMRVTVLPEVTGAPMLEAPEAVAETLNALLAERNRR